MNILVCVKQVPDTTAVKIDPVTNTLIRAGVPSIVNPFDGYALEVAARLKGQVGGKVTVMSMGPPQAMTALRECLAVGADQAFLVSGREFGGSDTLATSFVLANAVRAMEKRLNETFDLIICGKQAIDGDTGQVGPELGEHLDYAQVTYASDITVEADGSLRIKREFDQGYDYIGVRCPAVVTVVKTPFEPRLPTIRSKMAANKAEIPTLSAQDIEIDCERCGLKGSPTKVKRTYTPVVTKNGVKIEGESAEDAAKKLIDLLVDAKLV